MLHLTNGDSAAGSIRATGILGEVISWRDVLHEGPVPTGLPLEAMSEVRARFISSCGWSPFTDAIREFGARDAALRAARRLTLWFEHDLYDQLQLIQILATLAEQPDTTSDLIAIDSFPGVAPFYGLGQLSPAQLGSLWPQRQPVTKAQLTLGQQAWKAFTSPDPGTLVTFVAGDLTALPLLQPALLRLLEEYPAAPDGLSRTDRQILRAVAEGNSEFADLFAATQRMEEAPFAGDTTIELHVETLMRAAVPLLTPPPYQLTEAGRRVCAGETDARTLNRLDRWIGGVHLKE